MFRTLVALSIVGIFLLISNSRSRVGRQIVTDCCGCSQRIIFRRRGLWFLPCHSETNPAAARSRVSPCRRRWAMMLLSSPDFNIRRRWGNCLKYFSNCKARALLFTQALGISTPSWGRSVCSPEPRWRCNPVSGGIRLGIWKTQCIQRGVRDRRLCTAAVSR